MQNKKAQIGETMTWVIATIIILMTLVVSFYITKGLAEGKGVVDKVKDVNLISDSSSYDLITEKSLFVYTEDDSFWSYIEPLMNARQGEGKISIDWGTRLNELKRNIGK